MSRNLLSTLLHSLEAQDSIVYGFDELRSFSPVDIAALKQARVLVDAGMRSYVECDECGEYHTAEVHWLESANGRRDQPFYECTVDPSVGRVWLKLDRLQLLEVSFNNLCEYLARALCQKPDHAPVVLGRLAKLGHIAISDKREVRLFFACGLHRADAAKKLMPQLAQLRHTAVIVATPPPADLHLQPGSFTIEAGEILAIPADTGVLTATNAPILQDFMKPAESPTPTGNVFLRHTNFWEVIFEGEKTMLKHSRGVEHLAALITAQGSDIAALALYSGNSKSVVSSSTPATIRTAFAHDIQPTNGEPALFDDYNSERVTTEAGLKLARAEVERLNIQIADARRRGQAERVLELSESLKGAKRYLAMSTDDKGKAKRQSDAGDSARSAVQQTIKRVLNDIQPGSPKLHQHLEASLRFGTTLSYSPPQRVKWTLEK